MGSRSGKILFGLVAVCLLIGAGYVVAAALGPDETTTEARPQTDGAVLADADLMVRAVDPANPRLNGRVYEIDGGKVRRRSEDLACERVYYAGGRGICMGVAPSGVDYRAQIFDSRLRPIDEFALTGFPSRARVSADGRYGATTVFVSGDSYLQAPSAFSTRTVIVDLRSGERVGQLEQFDVTKDGRPFDAADFNFWGVTFVPGDSNRFYATLGTGRSHYLVEGDIAARSMRVLRDGVECPSLSPDGRQIVFKSRVAESERWRLRVLDVKSLTDHAVAETRSVDDQVEWLDDQTLVYSYGNDLYTAPADGGGEPQMLVRDASSPVRLGAGT
jgi:methyl coenzyme M reductase subunit C